MLLEGLAARHGPARGRCPAAIRIEAGDARPAAACSHMLVDESRCRRAVRRCFHATLDRGAGRLVPTQRAEPATDHRRLRRRLLHECNPGARPAARAFDAPSLHVARSAAGAAERRRTQPRPGLGCARGRCRWRRTERSSPCALPFLPASSNCCPSTEGTDRPRRRAQARLARTRARRAGPATTSSCTSATRCRSSTRTKPSARWRSSPKRDWTETPHEVHRRIPRWRAGARTSPHASAPRRDPAAATT